MHNLAREDNKLCRRGWLLLQMNGSHICKDPYENAISVFSLVECVLRRQQHAHLASLVSS